MHRAAGRGQQVQRREQRGGTKDATQRDGGQPVGAHYASAIRPLSGNKPRGRRWMNTIKNTSTKIFASTAPKNGSTNLSTTPRINAPSKVPHRFPTPPTTTTMKLSMM